MSSFPSESKISEPSSWEHTYDNVGWTLSDAGCLIQEQVQVFGNDFGLIESGVEYSCLTHTVQGHDATAIDLSTTTEEHSLLMLGEKTPVGCKEVPHHVLDRSEKNRSHADRSITSQDSRAFGSTARVCLEKRFNSVSADASTQQETQLLAQNTYLAMLQQSTLAHDAVFHPQMVHTDLGNHFGVPHPDVGCIHAPFTTVCSQVIDHFSTVTKPVRHQCLILPKTSSCILQQDVATSAAPRKSRCTRSTRANRDTPDSEGRVLSASQRKEKHNRLERERRKRIRLCCDELKSLVPFCDADTDKATTLQWTAAFLRYITKRYGDAVKEDFQRTFGYQKQVFDRSRSSSAFQEIDKTLTVE